MIKTQTSKRRIGRRPKRTKYSKKKNIIKRRHRRHSYCIECHNRINISRQRDHCRNKKKKKTLCSAKKKLSLGRSLNFTSFWVKWNRNRNWWKAKNKPTTSKQTIVNWWSRGLLEQKRDKTCDVNQCKCEPNENYFGFNANICPVQIIFFSVFIYRIWLLCCIESQSATKMSEKGINKRSTKRTGNKKKKLIHERINGRFSKNIGIGM